MGIDAMSQRAVFLDRDGVIDRPVVREGKPYPPQSLEELEILPGVPEALLQLREAGYKLVVVTNQPDVARGTQQREVVEAMHAFLLAELPLDMISACYHDDKDACSCRKPAPGLLLDAAEKYQIALSESYMIGDRWRDIEAGKRAGCKTVFIDYHYAETLRSPADYVVTSLAEAAALIMSQPTV